MSSPSTPASFTFLPASASPHVSFTPVRATDVDSDDVDADGPPSHTTAEDDGDGTVEGARTEGRCPPRLSLPELLRLLLALCIGVALALSAGRWSDTDGVASLAAAISSLAQPTSLELTPSEVEAAFLLTGLPSTAVSSLSSSTRGRLRRALEGVALTVLTLRPAMQREQWVSDCQSYLPCPYPSSALLSTHLTHFNDTDVHNHLVTNSAIIDALLTPPSPSTIFPPPPSSSPPSPSPSASSSPLIPGEPLTEQALTLRLQSHLHSLQHPSDCASPPVFVMDFFATGAGFGSWSHARAVALAVGFRMQRLVIEVEGVNLYMSAYSNCTRTRGLGGCDIFLPATPCPLPPDWSAQMERERVEWAAVHPEYAGSLASTFSEHLQRFEGRRWVSFSEVRAGYMKGMEWLELHHAPAPDETRGWGRELLARLPEPLAYLRLMPECWWQRQMLSYHFRTTQPAGLKLLTLIAQSLQLPHPALIASAAQRYADARAPAPTHMAQWWLSAQSVKTQWQVHLLDPTLVPTMRQEMQGGEQPATIDPPSPSSSPSPSDGRPRVPLLSHVFIRHGDKGSESSLHPTEEYERVMTQVATRRGLTEWYVGSDELLAPTTVRQHMSPTNFPAPSPTLIPPLHIYTNIEVDRMSLDDKTHSPVAGGWDIRTMQHLTDADREAAMWRSLVDIGVGLMADLFVSTWSSNHPRMVYELATAVGGGREVVPFVGLDGEVVSVHLERAVSIDKQGKVDGC